MRAAENAVVVAGRESKKVFFPPKAYRDTKKKKRIPIRVANQKSHPGAWTAEPKTAELELWRGISETEMARAHI